MKFQLVSDLHLETYKILPNINKLIKPSAPNLILAGDICYIKHQNFYPFFEKIQPLFERIFFIYGNHEYYTNERGFYSLGELEQNVRERLGEFENIYILQKKALIFDDIVIMGSTLWSYISKKDILSPIKLLADTSFVIYQNKLMFHPKITNQIHLDHKEWLKQTIGDFKGKKIIVVTHYLPSKKCIHPKFKYNTTNKLYYSNCDNLIKEVDIWCAGHTHVGMIKKIGKTKVFINPCGLLFENNNYKKDFTFEI